MVALEALKESIVDLRKDIVEINEAINGQKTSFGTNEGEAIGNSYEIGDAIIPASIRDIEALQQRCGASEQLIRDNRSALILYCQQFAFAPEMVGACAGILDCRQTQLSYRFTFSGANAHVAYNSGEHQSESLS